MRTITKIVITCIATSVVIPLLFYLQRLFTGEENSLVYFVMGSSHTFVLTFSIASANIYTARFLMKVFPWEKYPVKRIITEFLWTTTNATLIVIVIGYISAYLVYEIRHTEKVLLLYENIILSNAINLIVLLIYEGGYFFRKWKESLVQTEKLKRENTESQLAALRTQVNPHFLFNSLNALTSLIRTSPEKAIDFVNRFSKIYRYVLDVKDLVVVEIKSELDFLSAYYYLQKIRYAENLQIEVNVDALVVDRFIPPLSIQLLIENAIKHNEISTEFPLHIEVTNDDNYLIIKNNLNKKQPAGNSTKMGLKNLSARYALLTNRKTAFFIQNSSYIAKIPILNDE